MARILIILFLCSCCEQSFAQDEKPGPINRIRGNHTVKLVAAYYSEARGQNLIAEFKALDPKADQKTVVVKFPGHSFTPHEATIIAIIRSSVEWNQKRKTKYQRHEASMNPVFSIPKKLKLYDLTHWYLLKIEQKED